MKNVVAAVAFAIVGSPASAGAQTADDLRISISAYLTRPTGAEEPAGVSFVAGSLTQKTSGGGRFSVRKCGALTVEAGIGRGVPGGVDHRLARRTHTDSRRRRRGDLSPAVDSRARHR
jgi:hypothetical protein